ncbi:hypothetical protein [Allokutzneria sp. NRRL B-24872]|uniref:hypothetical protein n=1 Tax=Allokutzneria sp. NRRL B-24872 TaxID=1137961 RepID=UPI000A3C0630|nr:hypothetical protein [Allokutzneria sp. NRRL B-24872]
MLRKALVHLGIGVLGAVFTGVAAIVVEAYVLGGRQRRDGSAEVVLPRAGDPEALRVGLFVVGWES